MQFDTSSPIWLQLIDEFTRRIVTGQWPAGSRIPGVRDLAGELRVNPNTVQRALAELERQGLARSERTSGRYVTDDTVAIDDARLDLATAAADDFTIRARGLGMSLTAARDLLSRRWSAPPEGSST